MIMTIQVLLKFKFLHIVQYCSGVLVCIYEADTPRLSSVLHLLVLLKDEFWPKPFQINETQQGPPVRSCPSCTFWGGHSLGLANSDNYRCGGTCLCFQLLGKKERRRNSVPRIIKDWSKDSQHPVKVEWLHVVNLCQSVSQRPNCLH